MNWLDPRTRRAVMATWCRWKIGVDKWWHIEPEVWFALIVLLVYFMIGESVRGDTILLTDYLDQVVTQEEGGYVAEVGAGLSGRGNPLGWVSFMQPEVYSGLGPGLEFGSYSERFALPGVQSIEFYGDDQGYLRTALLGQSLTLSNEGQMVSYGYLRRSTQIPVGHQSIFVPFRWKSYSDWFDQPDPDLLLGGTGWISLTQMNQSNTVGLPSSYTIGEILITSGDFYAGQRDFQTVPEPGLVLAYLVGLLALVVFHYRRVKR